MPASFLGHASLDRRVAKRQGAILTEREVHERVDAGKPRARSDMNAPCYDFLERDNLFNVSGTGSCAISTTVGSFLSLDSSLHVVSEARSFSNDNPVWVSADFSNTGHYFVDSQDPGVTLVSASGHDYSASAQESSPVPEPATLILLGTGLAAVAARRRLART